MNSFLLGLLLAAGFYSWWVAGKFRPYAESSEAMRKLGLYWSGPVALLGVATALWLPEQIKFNRESPGGIFYVYLPCFLAGAALFFGGIGVFVASVRVARSRDLG
jgi:hypothetical protein